MKERREGIAKRGGLYLTYNPLAYPGFIKLGSAANFKGRLATFQTSCPWRAWVCPLVFPMSGSDRTERERLELGVGRVLDNYRSMTSEFFRMDWKNLVAMTCEYVTWEPPLLTDLPANMEQCDDHIDIRRGDRWTPTHQDISTFNFGVPPWTG